MTKIAIVYGSSTGSTEGVAKKLQEKLGGVDLYNAEDVDANVLTDYDFLIFGTSTSGIGDLQDDWDMLLPRVAKLDLTGKKVALFGLGDSASFSDSFAGSMSHIYKDLKKKVTFVGGVSTDGYNFDDSDSVIDGKFVGLALDEDNEYDKTDQRLSAWVEVLKKEI